MSRGTGSDTSEIRPAINFCLESNYWSENDICHSGKRQDHQLWSPIMQSTEEKDHNINDSALTPRSTNTNNSSGTKNRKKKSTVSINEDMNQFQTIDSQSSQNNTENFKPGSNRSPSILDDSPFNQNTNQNQSANITGHKRSQFEDDQNLAPSAKKQRITLSSIHTQYDLDNDWNFNDTLRFI